MRLSRKLYALKENPQEGDYFKEVHTETEAHRLNQDQFAIYWCVNEFEGPRRISNLKKINSWYVEFDDGDKVTQWEKIKKSPIIPSLVVESGRGYHVYWNAVDAQAKNYREIEERIIYHLGADPKVKDLTRVLRAPGYLHQKGDPFEVKIKFQSEFSYRERIMLYFFKAIPVPQETKSKAIKTPDQKMSFDSDLGVFLDKLDNEWALSKLSGHSSVNYETYSFKPVSRGRKNILVNGKGTSCFIDEHKRIGASPGGPVIFNWLRYYGHSNAEIVQILKDVLGYGN